MLIDTGATVNVIDEKSYHKLCKPCLKEAQKVYAYAADQPLPVLGKFTATIEKGSNVIQNDVVIKGNGGNLLSYEAAIQLKVMNVIKAVQSNSDAVKDICAKHNKVFEGLGKIKDVQIKLSVDETVQPTMSTYRRQPYHLRKKITEKIKNMEEQGLIEEVNGPTPYIVPLIAVPKANGNDICLCLDMRGSNTAIQRTRHNTPSLEDLVHDLNGAQVFSKLDMNRAYHQLELAPESRYLTTF